MKRSPLGRGASLRGRLLALSFAALLPSFLVLAYTEYQISRSRQAEVRDFALRSANLASSEVERILAGVDTLLKAVSRDDAVQRMAEPDCSRYLADLQPELPHLTGVTVIDGDGQFRCGSTPPPADRTYWNRSFFRDALKTPQLVVGEYTVGRASGKPVLPVARSIRNRDGAALGVVVAAIDLAWLGDLLAERGLPPGGSLTMADRNGVILARQPLPERFVGTRIPEPFMRLVSAPAAGTETVISQDGTPRVLGYVPATTSPEGFYISAGLSLEASYGAVRRAAVIGALLACGGALATLAATWLVGRRFFVGPVETVTGVLRRWREGDREARTGFEGSGEIAELGAELDRMMDEITRAQDQRELLAGELSHRVKNTLATVHAIAATTLNKAAPAREVLPDYLSRIAALARSHDVLMSRHWEGADLQDLVRSVLGPLTPDLDGRVVMRGPVVRLPAADVLGLTMVLHELCTNALKYGALSVPEGRVEIQWTAVVGASKSLVLTWRERGGPPVAQPKGRSGFGTRLMSRALGEAGMASLTFEPTGVVCRIDLTIADSAQDAA